MIKREAQIFNTQNRQCLFGDIADGQMRLNDAGTMIQTVWDEIPPHYPGIDIDTFIVMPNHIHGIIIIDTPHPVGAGPRACPDCGRPDSPGPPQGAGRPQDNGRPQGAAPTLSLPDVVHRFKTMTTKRYADGVRQHHWPPFPGESTGLSVDQYTEDDVQACADEVYRHVYHVYPTLPSPYYETQAA